MEKLFFSLGIITFGLTLGYVLQLLNDNKLIKLPMEVAALRKLLQRIGLLFFMAGSFFLALWVIKIPDMRLAAIPFIGLFALTFGGTLAYGTSKLLGHTSRQTGAMFGCGSFTNIGAIGALVVIVFLGEEGFALVALYKLFEEMYYYTLGFPIAKFFSPEGQSGRGESFFKRLKRVVSDVFVATILCAVFLGSLLNLTGVPRPEFLGTVNSFMVPMGTVILLTSIGLAMKFKNVSRYVRECVAAMSIKFLLVPLATTSIAWALGFGDILNGLPLKVVLICSSMPVAFNALIPPSLYDLDLDLANSCWLATTLGLAVSVPLIYVILQYI